MSRWILSAALPIAVGALTLATVPGSAQGTQSLSDGPHELVVVRDGGFHAGSGEEVVEIDDLTTYCMECHGPGTAGESAGEAPKAEHTVTGMGRSHPVDVAYPDGTDGYHPVSEVTRQLPLHDGRMTCLSCHSGTPDRDLLLPLKGSRLCIACHDN
jgi:predicted CXXCH cytochrome family protein